MSERMVAWPIYDIFNVADGQVFLGVVTDTQWKLFCEAFGLPELLEDPRLITQTDRRAARGWVVPLVGERLKKLTKNELMTKFEELGLPFAPIARPAELFDDPHLNVPGGLLPVTLADGRVTKLPNIPLSIDGERPELRRDLPRVGEHSAEIAAEIGYSAEEIAALQAAHVIL